LEAIAGASDIGLRFALARLRESGLIFEAGNDGESSYSFNHEGRREWLVAHATS
jgi:DNA-binding transcriptional regulator PaaX